MKRLLLLSLVFAVVFCTSIWATGKVDVTEQKPITLKYWTNDSFSPSTSLMTAKAVYERIFADFARENPNIKVEYEVLPGGTEALQKVLAAGSVNQLPDFGANDGFWVARLVQSGYLQPLNDLWPKTDRADFIKDAVDAVTFDGKIYAVWFYNGLRSLVYNKKVVNEAGYAKLPEERQEYIAASKKMLGKDRWAVMYSGDKTEYTTLHVLPYFWAYGGNLVDAKGKPAFHEGKNREALKRVYEWYRDMVQTHKIMPAEVANLDEKKIVDYFYAGQTVQWATSTSRMQTMKQNRPDLYDVLGVANYPIEKGYDMVGHLSGWTYGIFTKDPARQAASWKFLAALTSAKNLGELNEVHGHIPVRNSIIKTSTFFKEDPVFKQWLSLKYSSLKARDPVPVYPTASLEIAAQMGSVILGKITPDQAIDAAAKASLEEWERTTR